MRASLSQAALRRPVPEQPLRLERHCVSPEEAKGRFDPVQYLARHFDTIEINATFYGAPQLARASAH